MNMATASTNAAVKSSPPTSCIPTKTLRVLGVNARPVPVGVTFGKVDLPSLGAGKESRQGMHGRSHDLGYEQNPFGQSPYRRTDQDHQKAGERDELRYAIEVHGATFHVVARPVCARLPGHLTPISLCMGDGGRV